MDLNLTFLIFDLPFISNELLQRLLDSGEVRKNIKAWQLILEEKLKRNEIE